MGKKKESERTEKRKMWFKKVQKQNLKKPKFSLEDLSEEDFDSNDDLSVDDEEYGTLTDTEDESSEGEEIPEPEGSVSGDSSDEEKPQKSQSSNANRMPTEEDARTIFVGNLPNTVKKKKLKKFFSQYGEVECVRLRCAPRADPSIPKKVATIKKDFHESRSNIHGFVVFVSKESVQKAQQANGAAFDENHHIRVDSAIKPGSYDSKRAIFIGNLPFGAEEDQLRELFAECGDIESIRIVRDKKTCVGKGFAYVNFKERHSVPLALELDGETLGKRELRIQRVDYKSKDTPNAHYSKPPPKYKKNFDNSKFKQKQNLKKNSKNQENFDSKKKHFQGESGLKKEKTKSVKKYKLLKKRELLKKILNKKTTKKPE